MPATDNQLMTEFNSRRSEEAFSGLVRQHINLVFATALRQVGDAGIAEEVTQNVFVALAQSSGKLGRHPTIAGWLYRTTLNKARERMRSELRRRQREWTAVQIAAARAEGSSAREHLAPLLDEALLELREPDRVAVVMHYMEGQTFREVGAALGIGEDAARKRVRNCLEKLTRFFQRRGFAVPAMAGSARLLASSSQAAPVTLAPAVIKAALASTASSAAGGTAAGSGTSLLSHLLQVIAMTKTTAALVIVSAALPVGVQIASNRQVENAAVKPAPPTVVMNAATTMAPVAPVHHIVNGLDLDLLARELARLPGPPDRPEFELQLRRLMFNLDVEQLRETARLLNGAKNAESLTGIAEALFSRWAELNPQEAVAAAKNLPQALKWALLNGALVTWVAADPDAALGWLSEARDLPIRDVFYSVMFRQVARAGPHSAAERGLALGDETMRRSAVLASLEVWGQTAPLDALAWAEGRADEGNRNDFAAGMISAINRQSPETSMAVAEAARNPHVRSDGICYALLQWSQYDPAGAGEAFLKLPDAEQQGHTLEQLTLSLAATSVDRARELLAQIPEGSLRNTALAAVVRSGANDPAAVADVALELAASPDSAQPLDRFLSDWRQRDAAALQKWFTALPDSPGKRAVATAMEKLGGTRR